MSKKEVIDIQEAIENLSAIDAMNVGEKPLLQIVRGRKLIFGKGSFPESEVYLPEEGTKPVLEVLDATYVAVYNHLLSLCEDAEVNWENEKVKRGLLSLIEMVGESASKMDRYFGKKEVEALDSFLELKEFYHEEVSKRLEKERYLKSFEDVKEDLDYELFRIRNEDGESFFAPELLRKIKVALDLNAKAGSFEEDPFLKIRAMEDRDIQFSSQTLLGACQELISEFSKLSHKEGENPFIRLLSKAIFALFLASNPRHLIPETTTKSCMEYFQDFRGFLREAFQSEEYQHLIAYPPEEKGKRIALLLSHRLAELFFRRLVGIKQETIGLIYREMRRGSEILSNKKRGKTFWEELLLDDENFRSLMNRFPNGPLFKTLDTIREGEEKEISFDPIAEGNFPCLLYEVEIHKKKVEVLKIPCPTRQKEIDHAEVVEEFIGFLRSGRRHLLIDLQEDSWKEKTRSKALEKLSLHAEFHDHFFIQRINGDSKELDLLAFLSSLVKTIEEKKIDSISFTSKDALDSGASMAALFYGFMKLQKGSFSTKEERDFFLWLLYAPALFIRERVIEKRCLLRVIRVLSRNER